MKDIPGYEGLYAVDTEGNVYSYNYMNTGRFSKLKPFVYQGYHRYKLQKDGHKKTTWAHKLVALTFLGEPEDPTKTEVCHKDGNPGNNKVDNLYWGSHSDNTKDSVRHGTHNTQTREKHPKAKLTRENVYEVKQLLETGAFTHQAIADWFGVSRPTISAINNGRSVKTIYG